MSKQYRAYKPVRCTDGITSWVEHTFDNNVAMTPDDIVMMKSTFMGCAPDARIAAMQENLDSLKNPTSIIKLHADEIRAIHAGLSDHFHIKTLEEHESLHKADELWDQIVILRDLLPKAVTGYAVSAGGTIGGIIRGKQQSREKAEKNEVEIINGRGNVSDIINELALRKDELGGYLSARNELWSELIGDLDKLRLNPKEVCDSSNKPLRIDYRDGDGKIGQITFPSFKTMVSSARGKVK